MRTCVVALALAACSDASSGPVTGTATVRYLTATGEQTGPQDLSGKQYTAFPADGSYPGYGPVAGGSDGTVAIPDVPDGPIVLRVVDADGTTRWEAHDDRQIAWTTVAIGHPGVVAPTLHTNLGLDIDAMTPWVVGDEIYVDCFDNGTQNALVGVESGIALNQTALSSDFFDLLSPNTVGFDLARTPGLMIAGDAVVVSHLAFTNAPPSQEVTVLIEVATAPGVAETDGVDASVTGTFQPVMRTQTIAFSIDLDAFTVALPVQQGGGGWRLSVAASPGLDDGLPIGPPLASYFAEQAGFGLQSSGTITYGDPFDPSWPVAIVASYFQFHRIAIPDTEAIDLADEIHEVAPVSADFTATPHALLANSVTLDGAEVTNHSIDWDGRSAHVLHVDLPDGVSRFTATAYRLAMLGNSTIVQHAITIESTGSEVRLPAEAFERGELYALTIATSTGTAGATAVLGPVQIGHTLD
jgi:hypothetical protein